VETVAHPREGLLATIDWFSAREPPPLQDRPVQRLTLGRDPAMSELHTYQSPISTDTRHVVILAGGKGCACALHNRHPKPLVPIGEQYSILEIVLRQLSTGLHQGDARHRPPGPVDPRVRG